MLKLTKKADYGLIAVKHLAEKGRQQSASAKDIADAYRLPQEALAKILQKLAKSGLLVSQHGTNGGYALARDPRSITVLEVIRTIDGPLFITSCLEHAESCEQTPSCNVREPLRRVNDSIRDVLERLTIADMRERSEAPAVTTQETRATELVTLRV